jgi:hypothetical protein
VAEVRTDAAAVPDEWYDRLFRAVIAAGQPG